MVNFADVAAFAPDLASDVMRLLPREFQEAFVQSPNLFMLFASMGLAAVAVLSFWMLTGMGKDGGEGARELGRVGAPVWTESSLTAAIDGMPTAAAHAHGGAVRLPLDGLAAGLVSVLSTGGSS